MKKALFMRFLGLARWALGQPLHVYWVDPTKPPGFPVKQPDGTVTTASGPSTCPICNSHEYLA